MLKKKIIVIFSSIIIFSIVLLFIVSIIGLQRLFYHESSLIYDAQFSSSYTTLDRAFSDVQSRTLNVCVDDEIQQLLRNADGAPVWTLEQTARLSDVVGSARFGIEGQNIRVYPVDELGRLLSLDASGVYRVSDQKSDDYPIGYGFMWEFHPENSDTIRVTKKLYDTHNNSSLLAVVVVDTAISSIADPFWTFLTQTELNGGLYLLGEDKELLLPYRSDVPDFGEITVSSLSTVSYRLRNEQVTVMRSFIQNGWTLVGTIDSVSLLTGAKSLIRSILIFGILIVAIGIVLVVLISDWLTAPIIKLAGFMERSTKNNTYEEIVPDRAVNGEALMLYRSYNTLMDKVNLSMEEIRLAGEREVKNEFLLLQSQINPHFLYNTLDSIGWIANEHGAEEVRDMVINLAGMFRNSLNNGKPLIEVEREVEQVRCYLNIMIMRYPGEYEAEYEVEDDVANLLIIKQVLQPLAENALQHGLYGFDGKGVVKVRVYKSGDELVLEVRNNGNPADIDKISRILAGDTALRTKHYGIGNVDERLRRFYGANSALHFENLDGETIASTRIPLEKLSEEVPGE